MMNLKIHLVEKYMLMEKHWLGGFHAQMAIIYMDMVNK